MRSRWTQETEKPMMMDVVVAMPQASVVMISVNAVNLPDVWPALVYNFQTTLSTLSTCRGVAFCYASN